MWENLKEQLIRDEGLCLRLYKCPAGKLTIGVGHNLEDNGISKDEALYILENDILRTVEELKGNLSFWERLNQARREVLINMCFNLGLGKFLSFKKMLAALNEENYNTAAAEMLNSKWAIQVGDRAKRLAEIMKLGV